MGRIYIARNYWSLVLGCGKNFNFERLTSMAVCIQTHKIRDRE